jgi:Protein of unknown function (DUF3703)
MRSSDSECPLNLTDPKELEMNYAMNESCTCNRCAGEACQCGCQRSAAQFKSISAAYDLEISLALTALQNRNYSQCFHHLERAHVLGQRSAIKHTYAHWLMFRAGLRQRDFTEVFGQVPRMLASLVFSRIWVPLGNTGRARVPAMQAMPIPKDLRHLPL